MRNVYLFLYFVDKYWCLYFGETELILASFSNTVPINVSWMRFFRLLFHNPWNSGFPFSVWVRGSHSPINWRKIRRSVAKALRRCSHESKFIKYVYHYFHFYFNYYTLSLFLYLFLYITSILISLSHDDDLRRSKSYLTGMSMANVNEFLHKMSIMPLFSRKVFCSEIPRLWNHLRFLNCGHVICMTCHVH